MVWIGYSLICYITAIIVWVFLMAARCNVLCTKLGCEFSLDDIEDKIQDIYINIIYGNVPCDKCEYGHEPDAGHSIMEITQEWDSFQNESVVVKVRVARCEYDHKCERRCFREGEQQEYLGELLQILTDNKADIMIVMQVNFVLEEILDKFTDKNDRLKINDITKETRRLISEWMEDDERKLLSKLSEIAEHEAEMARGPRFDGSEYQSEIIEPRRLEQQQKRMSMSTQALTLAEIEALYLNFTTYG